MAAAGVEAERLRALLATARSECATQEKLLGELRVENQELQARLASMAAVSHQHTKTMTSSTSEEHSSSAVLVANPAFKAVTPGKRLSFSACRGHHSPRDRKGLHQY